MKIIISILAFLSFTSIAAAWPTCKGTWQQLPLGAAATGSTYRTGDGLTFQCVAVAAATPDSYLQNQKQQQQQQQTQQQSQAQSQQQNATATAGASSSSTGGSINNSFNAKPPEIPVETAYAPSMWPTVSCFKPIGMGAQTMAVGGSLGFGKIDENCAILEAAMKAHSRIAYCKIFITQKYVKRAGVTLDDCMTVERREPRPIMPQIAPEPLPQPPIIITPNITVPITIDWPKTEVKKPLTPVRKPKKIVCTEVK